MRITETHVAYWQAKRRPSWAPIKVGPSIDDVINASVPRDWRRVHTSNTLALLRLVMRRGCTLAQAFEQVCTDCPAAPRRAADVRKWRRKIAERPEIAP